MKYRYKISYGGTSSTSSFKPSVTTTRSNDFDAVYELDDLFIELNKINKNYDQNYDPKKFNYNEYNDPIIGKIYDQDDYKIIDDYKLLKIIPFVTQIYKKYYLKNQKSFI